MSAKRKEIVEEVVETVETVTPIVPPRGAIGTLCMELLMDPKLDFKTIVERVVAIYPTAKTSTRSLASVALDMRQIGIKVPERRRVSQFKLKAQELLAKQAN